MANYSPEQLFENTFNNYKQTCITDMQADNLKNMPLEELYLRTQALQSEPLNQPHNMNSQLTLMNEMISRLPNNLTRQYLQSAMESLQDNFIKQSIVEEGRYSRQVRPVRDYPPPRTLRNDRRQRRLESQSQSENNNNNRLESSENNGNNQGGSNNSTSSTAQTASETENDDSMNESQTTMGDEE